MADSATKSIVQCPWSTMTYGRWGDESALSAGPKQIGTVPCATWRSTGCPCESGDLGMSGEGIHGICVSKGARYGGTITLERSAPSRSTYASCERQTEITTRRGVSRFPPAVGSCWRSEQRNTFDYFETERTQYSFRTTENCWRRCCTISTTMRNGSA